MHPSRSGADQKEEESCPRFHRAVGRTWLQLQPVAEEGSFVGFCSPDRRGAVCRRAWEALRPRWAPSSHRSAVAMAHCGSRKGQEERGKH